MSYVKQNFSGGQVLTATNLNHMEDGIAAAGTVKSVNGVMPDENGNIQSDIAVPVLITHLKFPTFEDIRCNKTCEELHHSFLTQSTEATSIALLLYTAVGRLEEYRYCTNFVLEKVNENFTKRYFLYFGEDIAPYIVDVEANTITADPNWVAPKPNITEEKVNELIIAALADIPNAEEASF